jgi:prolyl-tRNA synthetase
MEAGERIYDALVGAEIDVLLDDREERPGVKFKDADLIGFPYRVTVGPKGVAAGTVELLARRDGEASDLKIEHAAETIVETVLSERR